MTSTPRAFAPHSIRHQLLLTAITPLAHHDPSVQDDSNRNLFNRQALLVPEARRDAPQITVEQANALAASHPVPAPLLPLVSDLDFPEYLAVLLLRHFMDEYNSRDGSGLFSGTMRYQMLGTRVTHAAYTDSLRRFYSRLTTLMQVGLPRKAGDNALLRLWAAPLSAQLAALHVLRTQGHDLMRTARAWHDVRKQASSARLQLLRASKQAAKHGPGLNFTGVNLDPALLEELLGGTDPLEARELLLERGYDPDELLATLALAMGERLPEAETVLTFTEESLNVRVATTRKLEIPHLTANSIRHQLLRESAMRHLFRLLDVEPESLTPGAEAIFYNGGNIKAGASAPSNPALLARKVREAFPSLDLLGGVTNSFDLGESGVSVSSLLVCRETRHLLPEWAQALPTAETSAFDLLEDSTLTRQALGTGPGSDKDRGQMIFGFENLVAGSQFLVTLDFKSYTTTLARGAALAAIAEWQDRPYLGGGAARGYGAMRLDDWKRPDPEGDAAALEAYEAYLRDHADGLRAELISGHLGAGSVVVS